MINKLHIENVVTSHDHSSVSPGFPLPETIDWSSLSVQKMVRMPVSVIRPTICVREVISVQSEQGDVQNVDDGSKLDTR